MSVIDDVLNAVINQAEAAVPELYAKINIGAMPPDNGISVAISTGSPEATFQTKAMVYSFDMVLNGKHTNAETVFNALNDIHQALTLTKTYPKTDKYQVLNIITTSTPSYIGREENSQILYGSSLEVRFYFKQED